MAYEIDFARQASEDLEALFEYVLADSGPERAVALLDTLEAVCNGLNRFPERGNVPKELRDLGVTDYRERHEGPYRIIYRIFPGRVVIYGVLDGRRDMQTLLMQRLLRG